MAIATIILSVLLLQDDTGEQFFKFKKDTCFTFNVDDTGKAGKLVMTVLEEKDGRVFLSSKEFKDPKSDEASKSSTMVWFVEEGCLAWGGQKGDKVKTMWHLYKLGSKKGDAWKALGEDGEVKNLGTEEVTVPAGTYKDVVHTQITLQSQTIDFYLAPNVGVIKFMRQEGTRKVSIELKERTEAK